MSLKQLLAGVVLTLASSFLSAEMLNINTADAQTLADAIKGIGAAKAEAIVSYREEHGRFESVDDLRLVRGIGGATVEKNRASLTTGEKHD